MAKAGLVGGRYQFDATQSIGSGAFSRVHPGIDVETGKPVAVKVLLSCQGSRQLQTEARLLRAIQSACECYADVPKVLWHGQHADYEVTVMSRLGACLLDLMLECGKKFSLKTVLMLTDQMVQALEAVHNAGFIHRDIKPDNLLMGQGRKENQLYLIDFGLSESYLSQGTHLPMQSATGFKGNYYWASSNVLQGVAASRRDDLEAMFYVVLFLDKGELPWQVFRERKGRLDRILEMRNAMPSSTLCSGLPGAFLTVFNYIKALAFEDKPDYDWIRSQFRSAGREAGIEYDFSFDWKEAPKEFPSASPHHDLALLNSASSARYSQENQPLSLPNPSKSQKRRGSMMVGAVPTGEIAAESHSQSPNKLMAALNAGLIRSPGSLLARSADSEEGDMMVPRPSRSTNDLFYHPEIRDDTERLGKSCVPQGAKTLGGFKICVVPANEAVEESEGPNTPKGAKAPALSESLRLKLKNGCD